MQPPLSHHHGMPAGRAPKVSTTCCCSAEAAESRRQGQFVGGRCEQGRHRRESFAARIGRGRTYGCEGSCGLLDEQGALVQVIEYTMDLTEQQKQLNANFEGSSTP